MGPPRHLALQVLVCVLAVAGGLLGVQNRPEVVLAAGTPAQHVSALRQVVSLPAPDKATRDFYGTACGLPTRYCVLRPTAKPRDLVDDVVDLLVQQGAQRVDGRCAADRHVELPDCHQRLVLDGVGLLVAAGNEVVGTEVSTFATVVVAGEGTGQARPAAPLASLKLLGLEPTGFGRVPCVERRGAGCARYQGVYRDAGTVSGLASAWRARLARLGYRLDVDRCGDQGCRLAASRFRTFAGQDAMSVIVDLADAGAGQVLQRLLVSVPTVTTP